MRGDERLEVGLALIREALEELRRLQFELSPQALYLGGLPQALESLAAHVTTRFGIAVDYAQSGPVPDLPQTLAVVLYQCARELVYNLVKHADARHGTIQLRSRTNELELEVQDDGNGFTAGGGTRTADATGGYGLYSVRERLAVLGGHLDVESSADGSRMTMHLPPAALGTAPHRDSPPPPATHT